METSPDEEGNVLVLERVSVKPYRSQDEYIYAMKEDLADWFNKLYSELTITESNFFNSIETGVVLCQHANTVQNYIHEFTSSSNSSSRHSSSSSSSTEVIEVLFRKSAKSGSFQSRDNISNFLHWCRNLLIPDTLLFETEDLVSRKNERNVVLCLLEVARRGAKYGVPAPTIIEMEQEIDREIEQDSNPQKPPTPPVQRKTSPREIPDVLLRFSFFFQVRELIGRCTCPDQFPIIRVSEGKYKIGENETLIFVRILRNHVMVRIGGGWDTLENYLNRHDPCRCALKGPCPNEDSKPCIRPPRKPRSHEGIATDDPEMGRRNGLG
ncbi:hypothetical protein CAPTEDRAFT_2210 [Capitella teleta]|uniref:GAR domain-containing protein n=1 Tax=Capitella teleta TaxID=283909 RepID=R7TXH0_CAPTE|nr:hypothetical protein CAPTEDRAFT_2210 [Capitella teleta]|eukprot:ELT98623.1 hypothetical protein CAPTEDRAFT_2210 [Capitella teleta]